MEGRKKTAERKKGGGEEGRREEGGGGWEKRRKGVGVPRTQECWAGPRFTGCCHHCSFSLCSCPGKCLVRQPKLQAPGQAPGQAGVASSGRGGQERSRILTHVAFLFPCGPVDLGWLKGGCLGFLGLL